jgi:hypothetical protein
LAFLTELYEDTESIKGYSTLCLARSAVKALALKNQDREYVLVEKFLKGVFNLRPVIPKTGVTWDAEQVLDYLRSAGKASENDLKLLTEKLNMLLLLLSGQRGQTIWLMNIKNLTIGKNEIRCRFGDLLKTSGPRNHQEELVFKEYPPNRKICVVTYIKEYLERTKNLRGEENQLLISYQKPHKRVSRDTVRRWTKNILKAAGVDLTIFTPHSTRSASTSKAATKIQLKTVLKSAGWRGESNFAKYYKRPIAKEGCFAAAILGQ